MALGQAGEETVLTNKGRAITPEVRNSSIG